MSGVWHRWAVLALTGLAFGLRVAGLSYQSLWRDEVDSILFASRPLSDLLSTFAMPGQNGPLYFLGLRPWLALAGTSEFALRFPSAALGVLAVPLVAWLGRQLSPRDAWVGTLAALLCATSPYLVWYGQEGKMYSAVLVAMLLSVGLLARAVQKGGWHRWGAYTLVTGAAFYLHVLAPLIVPAEGAMWVAWEGWKARASRRGFAASVMLLCLPYLPLAMWQWPMLLAPARTGYAFVRLPDMLASLASSFALGVLPGGSWWLMLPFWLLMLAGILEGNPAQRRIAWGVLVPWLLAPALCVYAISLARPIFAARYLAFTLPAAHLAQGFGAVTLGKRSRVAAACLVVALLAVHGRGVWMQAHTPLKTDFRSVTTYVCERLGAHDLVVFLIPHGRHSFDYYYEGPPRRTAALVSASAQYAIWLPVVAGTRGTPYRWADGPYTNAGLRQQDADAAMRSLVRDSSVVWLVESEAALWDQRGLVKAWLEENGRPTDSSQFVRVSATRYEMR